ncbi:E3 ubiquitin-protein ligase TRIM11 [Danio aesculapii]|uniref:E3 ubiquitin-protein ligase TRIM11 n=1 Tax=Danio aesculapii TaxID=1142201 RepID=UPI0024C0E228|nr:E3 ubiquitin-protein ligase TRIM11 [Danio aesculapii]
MSKFHKKALFVSCDLCVEVKTPALKTCLKCEISMCAQHLQTHLTTPVLLQTHALTSPVQAGSSGQIASKCSAHGKLVEYYCLDDHVLVCMSCAIEKGHRLHNMKTLPTAHLELVDKLNEEKKTLEQRKKQAKQLEMWHKNQTQALESCFRQLMETESALKDLVFKRLQTSVSARLRALQMADVAVSSALKEEDNFNFLQKFASVHKAIMDARIVDLKKGLESEPDSMKSIKEIRMNVQHIEKQVQRLQRKFLVFVDPEFHPFAENEPNAVSELTFDPQTLGPGMTLSKDLKTLFYNSSGIHNSPAPLKTQTVRCQQTNRTCSLRWFLNLSEHFDWTIGLCDTNARDGNYVNVFGLKKENSRLLSLQKGGAREHSSDYYTRQIRCHTFETLTISQEFHVTGSWKVEVIWDNSSNLLTIYSRNKPTKGLLLCKLTADRYTQNLCPFITLEHTTSTLQNRPNQRVDHRMYWDQQGMKQADNSFTELLCVLNK